MEKQNAIAQHLHHRYAAVAKPTVVCHTRYIKTLPIINIPALLTPYGVLCIIKIESILEVRAMILYPRIPRIYPRLRILREASGKTQLEIAQMLDMHLTVYQRYERGERAIPFWAAIKLAGFYKVSLDYIAEIK